MGHSDAGLPRIWKGRVRNLLFRCQVILIDGSGAARYNHDVRLVFAGSCGNAVVIVQRDGGRKVEPEHLQVTVFAAGKFVNLGVDKVEIPVPFFREFVDRIVRIRILRREIVPPEIIVVPVGYGEICSRHYSFSPEGVEQFLCNIGFWTGMERTTVRSNLVVVLLRVEHVEAVMVLGGKHHIFHSCILCGLCPGLRVEGHGIELGDEIFVRPDIFLIAHILRTKLVAPLDMSRIERPGLDDSGHAVSSPMDKQTELLVLPIADSLFYAVLERLYVLFLLLSIGNGSKSCKHQCRRNK